MAKWWDDLKEKAVEYLTDRYGGDKAVSNIIGDATALTGAYTTIADQKRANEAMESAYRDYTRDKAESQETINAALALGLQPMAVSNIPTNSSNINLSCSPNTNGSATSSLSLFILACFPK